jgi:hypothetical protein
MEKISRILPSSHRFRKIDVSDSHAARPGAISLGLQQGALPVRERISLSPESLQRAFQQTLGVQNPTDSLAHRRIQELAQQLSGQEALGQVFEEAEGKRDLSAMTSTPAALE